MSKRAGLLIAGVFFLFVGGGVCLLLAGVFGLAVVGEANRPSTSTSTSTPGPIESPAASGVRYAIERWQIEHGPGSCPTLESLSAAGLLVPGDDRDEWGRPWSIECTGATVTARSSGADGAAGTADDVLVVVGG